MRSNIFGLGLGLGLAITLVIISPTISTVGIVESALAQSSDIKSQQAEADKLIFQGIQQLNSQQFEEAYQSSQKAIKIYRSLKDKHAESSTLETFGGFYAMNGEFPKAIEYLEQSLSIYQEIKDKESETRIRSLLGNIYTDSGNYAKASEYLEQSIQDLQDKGYAVRSLGDLYYKKGEYNKAIEYYQKYLVITRQTEIKDDDDDALEVLGDAYHSLGDYNKAIEYHHQRLEITRKQDYMVHNLSGSRASGFAGLGHALQMQNQPELAIVFYKESLHINENIRQTLRDPKQHDTATNYDSGISSTLNKSYMEHIKVIYQRLSDLLKQQNRPVEGAKVLDLLNEKGIQAPSRDITIKSLEFLAEEEDILEIYDVSATSFKTFFQNPIVQSKIKELKQHSTTQKR
jgi:tetratricopeptide (TPR) repeat protein